MWYAELSELKDTAKQMDHLRKLAHRHSTTEEKQNKRESKVDILKYTAEC